MWQPSTGGGYSRRLLRGSMVQEEAAMWKQGTRGGCYVAAGYRRRLPSRNRVQSEAPMWKQGKGGGGCYVAMGYKRRSLCGGWV